MHFTSLSKDGRCSKGQRRFIVAKKSFANSSPKSFGGRNSFDGFLERWECNSERREDTDLADADLERGESSLKSSSIPRTGIRMTESCGSTRGGGISYRVHIDHYNQRITWNRGIVLPEADPRYHPFPESPASNTPGSVLASRSLWVLSDL
jgi:hypothetical protein